MILDEHERVAEVPQWGEYLNTDPNMVFDVREFVVRQRTRLVEDGFANADFADVVETSG